RVRTELLQHEVQVESFGGAAVDVEVSAKNNTNLDKLLEISALQTDLLPLKTNSERPAEGTVIEAKLDRGRGPVATGLVQRGTLRVGDMLGAGGELRPRHAAGRADGPRPRADLGSGRDGAGGRSFGAGRGARLQRSAGSRRSSRRGRERSPRPPGHQLPRAPEARERGCLDLRHARLARADDVAVEDGWAHGIPADHQGRRAGLAGSDPRLAGEARHRRSRRAYPACGCRRHL